MMIFWVPKRVIPFWVPDSGVTPAVAAGIGAGN